MIKNISKKKVLIKNAKFTKNTFSQGFGLMFKKKINYGLVFNFNIENIKSIHTCFMRFPIDLLFLNSNMNVTKVVRYAKPWTFSITGRGKYVIELPAGKSFNTAIGDKISFK